MPEQTLPNEIQMPKELQTPWRESDITKKLDRQKCRGWTPTSLISDFDNSYFSKETVSDTQKLAGVASRHDIPVVIVTGNDTARLIKKVKENNLHKPDVIIGAVGTEIYILHTKPDGTYEYRKDAQFDTLLSEKKFDRKLYAQKTQETITEWQKNEMSPNHRWRFDFQNPEIERIFLSGTTETDVQPYKLSFYAFAQDSDRDTLTHALQEQFPEVNISLSEEIRYNEENKESISNGAEKKFCIDMLPVVPKAYAVNYVTDLLGIQRGFNVGDSGNDILLLANTTIGEGVIVGGAKPELHEQVLAHRKKIGDTGFSRVFTGEGKPTRKKVYYNETTPSAAAGTIIEAAIQRLEIMKRFERNPSVKTDIAGIIAELQQ